MKLLLSLSLLLLFCCASCKKTSTVPESTKYPIRFGSYMADSLRDGVIIITEKSKVETINCYLIIGSEKALLFDTGIGQGNIKQIVGRITDKPIVVVNSHSHYDHIGGNYRFNTILSLNNEFTTKLSKGLNYDEMSEFYREAYIKEGTFPIPNYELKAYASSDTIWEGQKIDLGNRKIEVIQTPGHTPDAICLLDLKSKFLFTGDSFYKGTLFLHLKESNWEDFKMSIHKLTSRISEYKSLFPSHSAPDVSPNNLTELSDFIQSIENNKTEVSEIGGHFYHEFNGWSMLLKN